MVHVLQHMYGVSEGDPWQYLAFQGLYDIGVLAKPDLLFSIGSNWLLILPGPYLVSKLMTFDSVFDTPKSLIFYQILFSLLTCTRPILHCCIESML